MRGLAGKIAVVTGARRGIGRAIAERLHADGATVVMVDREPNPVSGERLFAFTCDVSDPEAVARLFDAVTGQVGVPQLLVNNVGGGRERRTLADLTPEALHAAYASNVVTMVVMTREFARRLAATELTGAVVNLSSSAAVRPKTGRMQYTGAKAAVSAITQSLALELAPRIRVNAVCPGPTLTEEIRARFEDPELRKLEEQRLARIPMGRMAEPAEVADAVAFLLSDEARYITGALLPVDGGYTVAT
ncbi:MAG: glucose 1-dehydrogenase [Bacillota bacterium]|nr:glucose 1-dehydrogenase [Bacillota bacterium]PZN39616.1 MAG: short-chain dehydrogenase [Bacillota bacterium]